MAICSVVMAAMSGCGVPVGPAQKGRSQARSVVSRASQHVVMNRSISGTARLRSRAIESDGSAAEAHTLARQIRARNYLDW
jgi:hypothetical protein